MQQVVRTNGSTDVAQPLPMPAGVDNTALGMEVGPGTRHAYPARPRRYRHDPHATPRGEGREVKFRIASFVLVAAVIIIGKEYYRDATAADLRWILAPTAYLVSLFTGGHFIYEAGAGYADNALKFVIAPPCAGLNFAMAAFAAVMLASTVTDWRAFGKRVAIAAGLAYVATIVINTIRISIAVAMHRGTLDVGMADRATSASARRHRHLPRRLAPSLCAQQGQAHRRPHCRLSRDHARPAACQRSSGSR